MNENTIQLITTYGVRVVGVIAMLLVSWLVAGWTRRAVQRAGDRANLDQTLSKFFSNISRYLVLIMALLAALSIFGIETTSFAAVLGAAGLAVGLALQGSLSNFAAGVMLLVFRPFKVTDVVKCAGHTGRVDEIELFTTKIITPDNRLIVIPNGMIWTDTIENLTALDVRRVDVEVGVDYGADLTAVREALEKVVAELGINHEKGHQIVLTGLGASSVDWVVRIWAPTLDYWGVREKMIDAVKRHLDDARIGIPFPQMDVHIDGAIDRKAA